MGQPKITLHTIARYEVLGTEEDPITCNVVTSRIARRAHAKCRGPKNGRIKPGDTHYVLRDAKSNRVLGRYCNTACYDLLKQITLEAELDRVRFDRNPGLVVADKPGYSSSAPTEPLLKPRK